MQAISDRKIKKNVQPNSSLFELFIFKKCKCNRYLKPFKLNLITNIKSKFKAHKKNKNHEAMQKYKNNMEQKHTNS